MPMFVLVCCVCRFALSKQAQFLSLQCRLPGAARAILSLRIERQCILSWKLRSVRLVPGLLHLHPRQRQRRCLALQKTILMSFCRNDLCQSARTWTQNALTVTTSFPRRSATITATRKRAYDGCPCLPSSSLGLNRHLGALRGSISGGNASGLTGGSPARATAAPLVSVTCFACLLVNLLALFSLPGYWGSPTCSACPGGAANPCSGNGYCHSVNGCVHHALCLAAVCGMRSSVL